jgi:hypothetical protein
MRSRTAVYFAACLLSSAPYSAVMACGDSEAGLSCDDSGSGVEMGAKWMLNRASKAVLADKTKAFSDFTKGMDGFRTVRHLRVLCRARWDHERPS